MKKTNKNKIYAKLFIVMSIAFLGITKGYARHNYGHIVVVNKSYNTWHVDPKVLYKTIKKNPQYGPHTMVDGKFSQADIAPVEDDKTEFPLVKLYNNKDRKIVDVNFILSNKLKDGSSTKRLVVHYHADALNSKQAKKGKASVSVQMIDSKGDLIPNWSVTASLDRSNGDFLKIILTIHPCPPTIILQPNPSKTSLLSEKPSTLVDDTINGIHYRLYRFIIKPPTYHTDILLSPISSVDGRGEVMTAMSHALMTPYQIWGTAGDCKDDNGYKLLSYVNPKTTMTLIRNDSEPTSMTAGYDVKLNGNTDFIFNASDKTPGANIKCIRVKQGIYNQDSYGERGGKPVIDSMLKDSSPMESNAVDLTSATPEMTLGDKITDNTDTQYGIKLLKPTNGSLGDGVNLYPNGASQLPVKFKLTDDAFTETHGNTTISPSNPNDSHGKPQLALYKNIFATVEPANSEGRDDAPADPNTIVTNTYTAGGTGVHAPSGWTALSIYKGPYLPVIPAGHSATRQNAATDEALKASINQLGSFNATSGDVTSGDDAFLPTYYLSTMAYSATQKITFWVHLKGKGGTQTTQFLHAEGGTIPVLDPLDEDNAGFAFGAKALADLVAIDNTTKSPLPIFPIINASVPVNATQTEKQSVWSWMNDRKAAVKNTTIVYENKLFAPLCFSRDINKTYSVEIKNSSGKTTERVPNILLPVLNYVSGSTVSVDGDAVAFQVNSDGSVTSPAGIRIPLNAGKRSISDLRLVDIYGNCFVAKGSF